MKSPAITAAAVACLGLSACAGTPDRSNLTHARTDNVDAGKVLAVNQWAVRRGATVIWINYPSYTNGAKATDG